MDTLLVVDDEPASLRTIRRTVADLGEVLLAESAAAALAALAEHEVAVIIADQRMPEMSGTRLLAICAERHPRAVRILLTGYSDNETLVEAINAGHVYFYLTKPWEASALRLAVQRALERHAAEVERHRLLEELRAALARACREAQSKGRLLALAAHEIGTPLHIAANAVDIATACRDHDQVGLWLARAGDALRWLGRVAAQLHRAGEWDAGGRRLRRQRFELGECLQQVAALYAPAAVARHVRFDTGIEMGLCIFEGDRRLLAGAVGSLLSNAIRFTPDGGVIALRATRSGSQVCIEVEDTGVGIEAESLPEIFEPFSGAGGEIELHGSGALAFGARGIGLGLALARAAVEAHAGRIEVDSEVGSGSRFRIVLPCT